MKHEKNLHCFVSALLAFLIAFGGVGCMVTGLKLSVTDLGQLALACAAAAVVSALCYRFRHGGWVLSALILCAGYCFVQEPERLEIFMGQVRVLLNRMTRLWNNAYGWHVVSLREERVCDIPLMLIGGFVAMVVARTVCRRKRAVWATIVSLLPLVSCLVVTDTVPNTEYLFLLLLGLAVLLLSNSVRRFDLRQGLELTGMAAVAAGLSLTLLFGLVPRESYVNKTGDLQETVLTWAQDLPAQWKEWGQENAPGVAEAVQTQRENLATLGKRIERDTTVMRVTASTDGLLYLRGQDFDSYDGKTWTAVKTRAEVFLDGNSIGAAICKPAGAVTIDALRHRSVLYVPYYPQLGTTFTGGRLGNSESEQIYSFGLLTLPENWQELVNDQVTYDEGVYATAGVYDSAKDQWRYRTLPLETKARAEELLRTILPGDGGTATGKAEAIAEYVRNSAVYSLDPGTMPAGEEDFALWFLEDQEKGYCVHFATAAAVLLRAAGVDARYVTGYVLEAKAGQQVSVPARQSHAWVEYFEPRLGAWVILEATPADIAGETAPAETVQGEDITTDITLPTEAETTAPTEAERPEQDATIPGPLPGDGPENKTGLRTLGKFLKWLLTIALMAAAVYGQYRLRLQLRRKRQRTGSPNIRALALWQETGLLYRLLKQPVPEDLEILAQKAKFSQHTLAREELACFEEANRECRARLGSQPLWRRLLHQFIFAAY